MASETPNFGLYKPDSGEGDQPGEDWSGEVNENFDIIDEHLRTEEGVRDIVGALIQANGNITTTYDDANDTLTIDTSALNEEEVEDAVAALVTAGNAITVNYDDAADSLSIAVDESALSFYDGTNLTAPVDNQSVSTDRLSHDSVYNFVSDFGGDPDPTVDDTAAFEDASQTIRDVGGDCTVYFPQGTFIWSKSAREDTFNTGALKFHSTPNVEITGPNATIKQADNSTADGEGCILIYPGPEAEIHHITLDGNWQNNTPVSDDDDGSNIKRTQEGTEVHHVKSINATGDGVETEQPDNQIHHNYFEDCWEQAVHVWQDNTQVNNNIIKGTRNDGHIRLYTDAGPDSDVYNVQIHDNIIMGGRTSGVQVALGDSYSAHDLSIKDNTLIDIGQEGTSSADDSGRHGIQLQQCIDPVVEGNKIVNPANNGMEIRATGARLYDNVIHNAKRGINSFKPDTVVKGGEIADCGEIGVNLVTGTSGGRLRVEDVNLINNGADGIFSDVRFYSAGNTIDLAVAKKCNMNAPGQANHDFGVKFDEGAGTITEAVVEGCEIRNVADSPIKFANGAAPSYVKGNTPAIFLSQTPKAESGNYYWDDGTNTGSGTEGKRVYLGGSWQDAFTA